LVETGSVQLPISLLKAMTPMGLGHLRTRPGLRISLAYQNLVR
jgi:hypothetical protein